VNQLYCNFILKQKNKIISKIFISFSKDFNIYPGKVIKNNKILNTTHIICVSFFKKKEIINIFFVFKWLKCMEKTEISDSRIISKRISVLFFFQFGFMCENCELWESV